MKNSTAKQRPAMLLAGLCMTVAAVRSHAAAQSDAIASDPCVLITLTDLHSVLGVTFPRPGVSSDVESRECSYESDKLLVSVFTGNEELSEFQKDGAAAKKRNDTWGKNIKVSNVSAPYYQSIGEGRMIVWKNRTRLTIGVQDVTFTMSDDALEAAREKLINIALSQIN